MPKIRLISALEGVGGASRSIRHVSGQHLPGFDNFRPVAVEVEFEETALKSKGNAVGLFKVKLTHEPAMMK